MLVCLDWMVAGLVFGVFLVVLVVAIWLMLRFVLLLFVVLVWVGWFGVVLGGWVCFGWLVWVVFIYYCYVLGLMFYWLRGCFVWLGLGGVRLFVYVCLFCCLYFNLDLGLVV